MGAQEEVDDPGRPVPAVMALVALCCAVELILQLSDHGLLPGGPLMGRLRLLAYQYGAFWPGLLHDWRPNYPGQPVSMFATYAFLHGGLMHLAMNMITLVSLGRAICREAGQRWFLVAYAVSAVTGAVGYGLLGNATQPMVGASGALFGLAGVLLTWRAQEAVEFHASPWPILRVLGLLVGLNVVMWWAMNGMLAWQTHLGGFLGGVAMVLVWRK